MGHVERPLPGSFQEAHGRALNVALRVKGVMVIALGFLAGGLTWFCLSRTAAIATEHEVRLPHLPGLGALLASPWLVVIPVAAIVLCGMMMVAGSRRTGVIAGALAMLLLLGMVVMAVLPLVLVMAPLYRYEPL